MSIKTVKPYPGMIITEDVVFQSGEYDFSEKEGIIIGANDITIDGNGAILVGGCEKIEKSSVTNTEEFGYGEAENPNNEHELGFFGTGILIDNHMNVSIKNLRIKGFNLGIHAKYSKGITLEGIDLSDCFHDPDWGWDNHGFHGAIYFDHVNYSSIEHCKANNVWDALNLWYSSDNHVYHNDFSYTSDCGIKLWAACRNDICDNDFSYGLRISPGEVHARDSSSVLIESGSNDNVFSRNDMSHGGDGLFIRVLNGWMSTGNIFEENDCSYANNNAVEAWSDGNTYIRNKANYSSYGFWLGNSDNTELIENEVAYNGDMFHNAPETFGNCGIAIVNGSGTHFVLEGNDIHDNVGPGVAIRYLKDYPSNHWVIQKNKVYNNKTKGTFVGHGIYVKNAKFLTFAQNEFSGNEGEEIFFDGHVADVRFLEGVGKEKPEGRLVVKPDVIYEGNEVTISVKNATEDIANRLDLGDHTVTTETDVKHTYDKVGMYRISLTMENDSQAALDFKTLYVLPKGETIDCYHKDQWQLTTNGKGCSVNISERSLTGKSVIGRFESGNEHSLFYPASKDLGIEVGEDSSFCFALRYTTDAEPDWSRSTPKPVVRLYQDEDNYFEFVPSKALLEMGFMPINEQKDNWRLFDIDLRGTEDWIKCMFGKGLAHGVVNAISIDFGGKYEGYTEVYLDALSFGKAKEKAVEYNNLAKNVYSKPFPKALAENPMSHSDVQAPIRGAVKHYGDITARYATGEDGYYGVDFGATRAFDRVSVYFYENTTNTTEAHGEMLPQSSWIEVDAGEGFKAIESTHRDTMILGENIYNFEQQEASKVRVCFTCQGEAPVAIYGFIANNTKVVSDYEISSKVKAVSKLESFDVKLNKHFNEKGCDLGDMIAKVFTVNDEGILDQCIFETVIPEQSVTPNTLHSIPADIEGMVSGQRYALALGQTNLAESYAEGDCYRWIAGHFGINETFAIYDQGETKPTDHNWGTAWLQVICEDQMADYSHDSEHVGTRFGVKKMEYRYQTFMMPDTYLLAFDGDVSPTTGWRSAGDNDALCITLKKETAIDVLNLWVDAACEVDIEMDGESLENKSLLAGYNAVSCGVQGVKEIKVAPTTQDVIINQVEIVRA